MKTTSIFKDTLQSLETRSTESVVKYELFETPAAETIQKTSIFKRALQSLEARNNEIVTKYEFFYTSGAETSKRRPFLRVPSRAWNPEMQSLPQELPRDAHGLPVRPMGRPGESQGLPMGAIGVHGRPMESSRATPPGAIEAPSMGRP